MKVGQEEEMVSLKELIGRRVRSWSESTPLSGYGKGQDSVAEGKGVEIRRWKVADNPRFAVTALDDIVLRVV